MHLHMLHALSALDVLNDQFLDLLHRTYEAVVKHDIVEFAASTEEMRSTLSATLY